MRHASWPYNGGFISDSQWIMGVAGDEFEEKDALLTSWIGDYSSYAVAPVISKRVVMYLSGQVSVRRGS